MKKMNPTLFLLLLAPYISFTQGIDLHYDNYVPNHSFEEHGINIFWSHLGLTT